ncbi:MULTISPECIES: DUF551 domain-containing protein [Klebsiella pneumoniae complex]|uniref:DUF551 domain-containing protein n=1 Tax=Klebsiella pneumoniae complex TaxID=3390273 RepID=UPI001F3E3218|nr:DUF551 domain-containing protein [Klebsiella variicola]
MEKKIMAKSTITRERARQIFLGNGPEPSASEERELASMALAAMDSEPVIIVGDDGGDALSYRRLIQAFEPGTKLYRHAQPAPVVEREPIAWLNDAYLARGVVDGEAGSEDAGPGYIPVYREAGPQPAPVVPVGLEHLRSIVADPRLLPRRKEWIGGQQYSYVLLEEVEAIVDEACRAAMLAAAPQSPGSEPATVPGKWIPVSERMPESNGMYFGWDGKRVLEVYCFFGGFSANQFIHGEITHWMPLPAAPEEVK